MSSLNQQPDTPCVGICSTAIGDDVCRGCARTFGEISFWGELSQAEKDRCWACLSVRKVWLAVVRPLHGHLEILSQDGGEFACFALPDGSLLELSRPYAAGGQRFVPLRYAGRELALEVSREGWPQQLRTFLMI
jgi:predicted Fe-S protein YdhL (DUF1289 family)